ncbi:MAG: TonB-dependent receptor [Myxococcota bacterium]|nr:TonB-dependent receptor [Myxococcota bacterium]
MRILLSALVVALSSASVAQQPAAPPAPVKGSPVSAPGTTEGLPSPVEGSPVTVTVPGATDAPAAPAEGTTEAPAAPVRAPSGLRGRITDAVTGEPLVLCSVKVTEGGSASTETDLEGNFQLTLPPGSYTLRFWYDQYVGVDVKHIRVGDGFLQQDVALKPVEGSFVEELVVMGTVDRKSEGGLLLDRKMSNTVSDAISSEQISRSPDSNAGDAVKRVSSVTVVGRNVFLRGLGGRYAATTVNGVALPSMDPDGHQAPLDLFPNSLLSTLSVQKTYGAEMSGAFAGGVLGIETNSYPATLQTQVKLSLGGNTQTTFRAREGFAGGGSFLGLGLERPIEALPTDKPILSSDPQAESVSEGFRNVWSSETLRGLPNGSASVAVGNTHSWGGGRALGYLANVSLSRCESAQVATVRNFRLDTNTDQLIPKDRYQSITGGVNSSLGAVLNVGYQLDPDHDLGLLTLLSRSSESTAQHLSGYSDNDSGDFDSTRLKETLRTLSFSQVRGSHRLGADGAFTLKWQGNFQLTLAEEPDTRDFQYVENQLGVFQYREMANSGERFFSQLSDQGGGGSAQLRWSLGSLALTGGLSAQASTRSFDARRFQFRSLRDEAFDSALLSLSPEEMFAEDHLGPSFLANESTFNTDRYRGTQRLLGAFVSAELPLTQTLRAVAGARLEAFSQRLDSDSPFAPGVTPSAAREELQPMPSLNVIWAATSEMNLRGGYSFTVARPQFREIAPFQYYDAVRRRAISGNPALVSSRIHNLDARWEWFLGETEVLSAGGFFKQFLDPIEQVVVSANQGDLGYRNAEAATVLGLELEARASLGRLNPVLSPLRVGANVSLIHSQVSLGAGQAVSTSARRPLQGQSPYVVNANLGYLAEATGTEITALYNVFGPRISEVGFNYLPGTYEQPLHRLDLTVTQKLGKTLRLKATATNVLNQSSVFTQQAAEVFRFRPGATVMTQLEWSPL